MVLLFVFLNLNRHNIGFNMIGTLQSRLNIKFLLFGSAFVAIALFALILFLDKSSTLKGIISSTSKLTIVLTVISAFWLYVDKWGWRHFPSLCPIIRKWPNLNGRWKGIIDREGSEPPHPFIMEIKQTLTKLQCDTYTENGESRSVVTNLTVDEHAKQYFLYFVWLGGTRSKLEQPESGEFYGATILRLFGDKNNIKLEGRYFTGRRPLQTRGTLNLSLDSRKTRGSFS
jgi:hypothetical protein